jgi:hypothetical protein
MMWFWVGLALLCSLLISWQDIKAREIHLVPVVLLAASALAARWPQAGAALFSTLLLNYLIVALMMSLVVISYRLRGYRQVMDQVIGWGDVLTLLALASWMDTLEYLMFHTACLMFFGLGAALLRYVRVIRADYPIPLAGLLTLAFFFYQLFTL